MVTRKYLLSIAYSLGIDVRFSEREMTDSVLIPAISLIKTSPKCHPFVLAHELVHATGMERHLDRIGVRGVLSLHKRGIINGQYSIRRPIDFLLVRAEEHIADIGALMLTGTRRKHFPSLNHLPPVSPAAMAYAEREAGRAIAYMRKVARTA